MIIPSKTPRATTTARPATIKRIIET